MEENEKLQVELKSKTAKLDALQQQLEELQLSMESEMSSSHTEVHTTLIQREIVQTQLASSVSDTQATQESVIKLKHELQIRDQRILELEQKLGDSVKPNNNDADVIKGNEMLKRDIETKRTLINSLSKEKKTLERQLVILDDASIGAQRLQDNLRAKTIEVESLKLQLEALRSERSSPCQDKIIDAVPLEVEQQQMIQVENRKQIQLLTDELQQLREQRRDADETLAEQTRIVSELTTTVKSSRLESDVSIFLYIEYMQQSMYFTETIEPLYRVLLYIYICQCTDIKR
jgi:hypothetical protein